MENERGSETEKDHTHALGVSIIIRNISFHCDEDHLRALFREFAILWISVKRNARNDRSLLHAFADLPSQEEAEQLIQTYNNVKFMGRRMR